MSRQQLFNDILKFINTYLVGIKNYNSLTFNSVSAIKKQKIYCTNYSKMKIMTYSEKLQSEEWKSERLRILHRDSYTCQRCKKLGYTQYFTITPINDEESVTMYGNNVFPIDVNLHVHHKYYMSGFEPWDYEEDALISLCSECHEEVHKSTSIPVFNGNKEFLKNTTPCSRCGGRGFLPEFHHVQSGICFECLGEGVIINDL